jgi:hypothetical protein
LKKTDREEDNNFKPADSPRFQTAADNGNTSLDWKDKAWVDQELEGAYFQDVRLGKRLRTLLGFMSNGLGQTIPLACQDWANTKAAYRFFSNPRINEEEILSGHFASTQARAAAIQEPLLVLHDTTEFSFQSTGCCIGLISNLPRKRTVCGLLMHSSLVVTTDGLPLGLAAVKFWTRKHFKGTTALKRIVNPTRIPIEEKESFKWLENIRHATGLLQRPADCIHVADREGDIFELFCTAQEAGTKFLVRTCVDRLAKDGRTTINRVMRRVEVKGTHEIEVQDADGKKDKAILEIKYETIRVLPPIGKQAAYPELELTVIHARETSEPRRRERIQWKLVTNLPVQSLEDALEKIRWYALRWKIEMFHKILKTGCRAEQAKLRTAERLSRLIAVFCILSWRVFWMTMVQRTDPEITASAAITAQEQTILDKLFGIPEKPGALSTYLARIARLGGYLARANDAPPGNTIMWRGLCRLTDIQFGFMLAKGDVGN